MANGIQVVAHGQAHIGIVQRVARQVGRTAQSAGYLMLDGVVALGDQAPKRGQTGTAHGAQPP
ncbi:hypothetical protein D3C72_2030570 [compost metagenome]